jgi:hypothetical protein
MAVHNAGPLVARAIASIQAQTLRDLELLIVDDGSTDEGPSIMQRSSIADPRIHVHTQDHAGQAAALNLGCARARGKLIARMDADDVALPERLAAQAARMQDAPDLGLLGGAAIVVDEFDRELHELRYPTSDSEIRRSLPMDCPFAHPAVMLRNEVFQRTGGYRSAFAPADDYDLWLRIAEHHRLANLPQAVLRYRVHAGQLSQMQVEQQLLAAIGAQLAARLRRTSGDDALANAPRVTLDDLRAAVESQEELANAIVQAGSGRALFLAVLGQSENACRVLEWSLRAAGPSKLRRCVRARADIARAAVLYARGDRIGWLRRALSAGVTDPAYVVRLGRKGAPLRLRHALSRTK